MMLLCLNSFSQYPYFLQVFEFLEDISASLTDLATRELALLKDLKVGSCFDIFHPCQFFLMSHTLTVLLVAMHQKKEEGELPFGMEDLLYYVKRVEEAQFDLDFGALKQYFPVDVVLSGILKITQDLFGNYLICNIRI